MLTRCRTCGVRKSAQVYDRTYADAFQPLVLAPMTALLAELAEDRCAQECAVGTERVALPLVARGVSVEGIELSPHKVDRLRAKSGGESVTVTIGDMTSTRVPGTFNLVYLVAKSIMNVTTQDEQVAVFVNAARHLRPVGRFSSR